MSWIRIAGWLGALILLLTSIAGHPGVTATLPAPALLGGGLLLCLAALLLALRGAPAGWSGRLVVLSALLALALGSTRSSLDPFLSRAALTGWCGFAAMVLAVSGGVGRRDWPRFAAGLVGLACLACGYGLSQKELAMPLRATFTNPDCFSVLPLSAAFLASGLAVQARGRARIPALLAALFLLVCLVLTGSRAALLGCALGHGLMGLLLYVRIPRASAALALALGPALVGGCLLLSAVGSSTHTVRLERLLKGQDQVAWLSRLDVLRYSPQALAERPGLGFGPGTFALAYQAVRPPSDYNEAYMNVAHNDYVQVAVELGLPGLILWLALWGYAMGNCWRCNDYPAGWCAGLLGALGALATYSLLNFLEPVPASLFWLGALFGLSWALPGSPSPPPGPSSRNRLFLLLPLLWLIAGLACSVQALALWKQQRAQRAAFALQAELEWDKAYLSYEKADALAPGNASLLLESARVCSRAYALFSDSRWLDRRARQLEAAHRASPRYFPALFSLARFYEYRGDLASSERLLLEGKRVMSYNVTLDRALARLDILAGRQDRALQRLSQLKFDRSHADKAAQAELGLLVLGKNPARGLELFRRWGQAPDGIEITELAIRSARQRRAYTEAIKLAEELHYRFPGQPKYTLQLAELAGATGRTQLQLSLAQKLRRLGNTEETAAIWRQAWQMWAELKLARGDSNDAALELQALLLQEPQENWARPLLASIYDKKGLRSEARAVLRDGIPNDADGSLRLTLADLCMRHGHPEIARGYYEELLTLPGMAAKVAERLKQAERAAQASEDAIPTPESSASPRALPPSR